MKNNIFIILAFGLLVLFVTNKDNSINEDKKIKLSSCISLIKSMIKEDKSFIPTTIKAFVGKLTEESDKGEITTKISENLSVYCFSEISLLKAAELSNAKSINPFKKESKELLSHVNFANKYNKNLKLFEKDLHNYKETLSSLMTVATQLFNEIQYIVNDLVPKTKQEPKQKVKVESEPEKEINLFGYDLTSPRVKNTLGLSLFIALLVLIYLSYTWISGRNYSNNKENSKRKQKKTKEE